MKVLIGCEESQEVCKAFRALGHKAYSCDILDCSGGYPEWHLKMDVFEAIKLKNWDLAIFHPDCTYLTVTANKWLKDQPARKSGVLVGKERREAQIKAITFFMNLVTCGIKYIAIENPVGVMSTYYRKPDQIIQPYMFGHPEPKKTCLWLKNLPKLIATNIVKPEYITSKSGKRLAKWFYYDMTQKQDRKKLRSKTFLGIAKAMAEQWTEYVLNED